MLCDDMDPGHGTNYESKTTRILPIIPGGSSPVAHAECYQA